MICASNQNRSMAAHELLKEKGYDVDSYGTGSSVKLPGKSMHQPNVYPFGTPYATMAADLKAKDAVFYTSKGLLQLLERNAKVKTAPAKWQVSTGEDGASAPWYSLLVTFEERVYDALVDDLLRARPPAPVGSTGRMHVVNLPTKDDHENAAEAAKLTLRMMEELDSYADWEEGIDPVCAGLEADTGKTLFHTVIFG